MTYELAKQLKDAGFPQQSHASDSFDFIEESSENKNILNEEDFIAEPPLLEIIEACGRDFYELSLEHDYIHPEYDYWRATGMKEIESGHWTRVYVSGATPEIACANLYLVLRGK